MNTTSSKGKEIKIPGPDHPITIYHQLRERSGSRSQEGSSLSQHELFDWRRSGYPPVYYLPRNDADMPLLVRTTHYTYCPFKGDCTYYSIPIGGARSEYAVWTYEKPYEAVAVIKENLAFYPSRVDAIEVIS